MRFFIGGCGRSGTTLMRRIMMCTPLKVKPVESWIDYDYDVVKRSPGCRRYLWSLPDDWELIYMVRHPFNVITDGESLDKWRWEYNALANLETIQPNRVIHFVKFEDLIMVPTDVRSRLENLGIEFIREWEELDESKAPLGDDIPMVDFIRRFYGYC